MSLGDYIALKPKMEGLSEMALMRENFDPTLMGRMREDGQEGRSTSDNLEGGASGDDQDAIGDINLRRKKYHRHTPQQIQELEAHFQANNHPDEKERLELGRKLNLSSKQVKFWFQNRRTQMKTQAERHENSILKRQNEEFLIENIRMKEAMKNPICSTCGGPAVLGDISVEVYHLRVENARLRDELNRISALAHKFLGRPLSSLAGSMPHHMSNLELAVGTNGFGGLSSMGTAFPLGIESKDSVMNSLPMMPMPLTNPTVGIVGTDLLLDKSVFLELASRAMDELVKLAQIDNPLWVSLDGGREVLNHEEYAKLCPPWIKPGGFATEATRATGMVISNSLALVETLMDANQWEEMFQCMIGKASTIDVIFSGMTGSRNCCLQLMHAEFQVLSPLVPIRSMKFLRFCKQHADGLWAVVDVSVDSIREFSDVHGIVNCRRLPSGCVIQDMPNGYAKVTWVEHSEYDESVVHHLYRPLLSSGMGFGAPRWLVTLQRQCECLAVLMSSSSSTEDHTGVTPSGRRSIVKLAQRMTHNFCTGVCATMHNWQLVQVGNGSVDARLIIRNSTDSPGEPSGIVLSAASSIWMPVSQQRLFDFLRNEQLRSQWDELSHGGPMHVMVHIAKGQDHGNSVSLLRASAANTNQNAMLILQETQTDSSGSLIVYTAVDIPAMQAVMNGGDSASVALLPSGFAIVPDGFPDSAGTYNCTAKEGSGGSLLTVGFQILVNNAPTAKLTMESVNTVNNLISRTIQRIKAALNCAA
ncbi:hypothetical protein NMG60_11018142 [Bertholletia excelsa]